MAADQITVAIDPDVAFIATLRAYNHDGRVDRSLRIKGKLSENKLCRAGLDLVLKCPTRNFNRMVYTHSPLTFLNAYGRRPTASADAFGLIAAHQNALPLSFVVQVLADCLHNSVLESFWPADRARARFRRQEDAPHRSHKDKHQTAEVLAGCVKLIQNLRNW